MKASEQIEMILAELGIRIADLAKATGINAQRITDIKSGKVKNITAAVAQAICDVYPQYSYRWLTTQEGGPHTEEEENSLDPSKEIALIPLAALAGRLNDYDAAVQEYECERIISPITGVDLALQVDGNSMEPEYPAGCRVLVRRVDERVYLEWGKVYVLNTENGTLIKRIYPEGEEAIKCVSINPEYPPFIVRREYVRAYYRVLLMMSAK